MTGEERGFFLVLEGLPGSGKTSVGLRLKRLGWRLFPEVATTLVDLGIPVGDRGNTKTDLMILSEEMARLKDVRGALENGESVVLDGYFPTDLSFAYARYMARRSDCYPACLAMYVTALRSGLIIRPDLYVYLEIPLDIAMERQLDRGRQDLTTLTPQILSHVERHFHLIHETFECDTPVVKIDALLGADKILRSVQEACMKIRSIQREVPL